MASRRTIAEASLEFTGLFEVEVLLELMLRFWGHPLADNRKFVGCFLKMPLKHCESQSLARS